MNWMNWIYLGAGIALGLGFRRFFTPSPNSSSSLSAVTPLDQQDTPSISEQIQQTQLAYLMAREMSQFKAGFLARTTHELRSPLNGLIGLHQLILSDLCESPAEEREFIVQAHERTLKLLKLMDEILNVARTEHGTNKLDIQPRPLANILEEAYNLTYMLAANRNFKLQLLPADPEIYVLADHLWLRQILISLIDTAISQMEEGSIYISSNTISTNNFVNIWLDVPMNTIPWSEAIDLMESKNHLHQANLQSVTLSPGMRLVINQTLVEVMGGKLEIFSSQIAKELPQELTRIQISIPVSSSADAL
ncbi:histidine kinase [Nostoc linckia z18]|jgi:K+-sensing histidine kinase KdpD|uniref:histidine kinase n=2 Tax=Nostoc linckia TaxID=92942 RepID=A0A9Q6EJU2_NOSLI|nr:HAMP domain-containing sensor histidine kinase [Nostoc linckia]PHK40383.1 histidine kinase [Nostoc linckia z15]PHK48306.1 histidine kinase [Nostoc linckia z16]PHJ62839.1 histidine kinase [Nostoc linckia z3]PHJ66756.1 histidine kinase [Nostoc linckia z1]PHJ70388.1 histidine kinase [Nostoc linckia z2]